MAENVVQKVPSSDEEEEEVFTYRLRIHDAGFEDSGKWRCEVKDRFGTISTSCDLEIFENEQIKKAIESARQAKRETVETAEKYITQTEEVKTYTSPSMEKLKAFDEYVEEHEPTFLQSLKNTTVSEGGVARMACVINGNPKPQTKWFKDDIEIRGDGRINIVELRDGTNYLEFSSVAIKDSAIFKCEITSSIGQASSEAKLTVKSKKQYSRMFKAYDLDEHREMLSSLHQRISDNIEETDKFETTRYKHRNEINMMKSLYATEREADLKLRCKWEEEQQLYFRNNLNNKCVVDSGSVLLRCYVVGKPPFRARWFKDGKLLKDNVYERYFIRSRGGSMSLEIPCACLADTGEYTCEARNEQGRVLSTCYLQVEPKFDTRIEYEMPYFVQKIRHIHVLPGQEATFTCLVKGNPKPGIIWYKDGKELQNSSRITFHRQNNGGMLRIHEARYSDTGLYKCEAHSMAGRAVSSAKLVVVEGGGFMADFHHNQESIEQTVTRREFEEIDGITAFEPEERFKETVSSVIFPRIPSFKTKLPESMEIQEGERLVLSCRVDGFPKPQVTWMRNSEVIKDAGYIYTISEKGIHSLKIQSCVSERDAGIYTIRLNAGTKQEIESTCQVKVSGTISFKQTLPKTMQVKEGEKFIMKFCAESNPKPEVTWLFKSEELKKCDYRRVYTEDDYFYLEITSVVSERDSGEYTAKIKSGTTERICTCNVQVMRAPTFSKLLPKYVQVDNGKKLQLTCSGDGYPKPEATWMRNNRELEEADYLWMTSDGDTYSLEIPRTECKRDSGGYIIRLTSGTLSCESSSHVDVTRAPTFTSSIPKELELNDGDKLTLKCVVDGVPTPEVSWYHGDVELRNGDHLQITSMEGRHSLQINKVVSARDSGMYTVKLTTGTSQVEATCQVEITRDAGFTALLPKECLIESGEKLLLQCSVEGSPLPKVSWLRDGVNLKDADYVNMQTSDGNHSLEITKADFKRDSGTYIVKIVGAKVKTESSCTVDIKSAPVFTTAVPDVLQVGLGESLILKCKAEGNPKPEVNWFHYGKPIEQSDIVQLSSKNDTHILEIRNPVYPRDCGTYTVKLSSGDKHIESSCNVDIMRLPNFRQPLQKQSEIKAGEKLLLSCSVDGLPKPEVVWLHNGTELKEQDYVKLSSSNDAYNLEIPNPDYKRDSGTYTVRLLSGSSKEESSCDVQIMSAPKFTATLPGTVQVKNEEMIVLSCKIEGNPKPKVLWLHNGKELAGADHVTLKSLDDTYTLEIAHPDSKRDPGTYTIKAINGDTTEESTCDVQMIRPVTFTSSLPKDTSVKEGEKLVLSFKADAFPLPEVVWSRNGIRLNDENFVKISTSNDTYTMEIDNPNYKRDSGTYAVKLVSGNSKEEASCDVQIMSAPKFGKVLPPDIQVQNGEKLSISCLAEGNPKPKVIWLHNGVELTDGDYFALMSSDETYSLEISNSDCKRDSGTYIVRLQSGTSAEESKCEVHITSPPKFTKQLPATVELKDKESIVLTCSAEGYPKPEAVWLFHGKELKNVDYVKTSETDGTYTFEITSPDYQRDSGVYKLRLTSGSLVEETKCEVKILKPPSFKKPLPSIIDVKSGGQLALCCFIEGSPTPEVIWFHNDKKIEKEDHIKVTSSEDMCTLEIPQTTYPRDAGTYTAKITNGEGQLECTCKVNILSAPVLTEKLPENIQISKGDAISIKCSFDGYPKPQVIWLYNDKTIEKEDHIKISTSGDKSMLEIPKPLYPRDSGIYTVKVVNEQGQLQSTCKVNILSAPFFITKLPESIQVNEGETISVKCSLDGNPKPQVSWIHNTKDIQQDEHVKVTSVENEYKIEISNTVYNRDAGTYTAKIVNEISQEESQCEVKIVTTGKPEEVKEVVEEVKETITELPQQQFESVSEEDAAKSPSISPIIVTCKDQQLSAAKLGDLPEYRESPGFDKPLDKEYYPLEMDENVRIECTVRGNPCPEVIWKKDGVPLQRGMRIKFWFDPDTRVACVLIKRLKAEDTGEYECIATSANGTSVSKTELHIRYLEMQKVETQLPSEGGDRKRPEFTVPLKDVSLKLGESGRLECVFEGLPLPKIRWFKDGSEILTIPGKINITDKEGLASLCIERMEARYGGVYICEATNSEGTASVTANVISEDKKADDDKVDSAGFSQPVFTETLERYVTVQAGGSVAFKCAASGCPVPIFRWQKDLIDVVQSNRIIIDSKSPGRSTLALYNVNQNDSGLYICKAINRFGRMQTSSYLRVAGDIRPTRRMTWTENSITSKHSYGTFNRSGSIEMSPITQLDLSKELVSEQDNRLQTEPALLTKEILIVDHEENNMLNKDVKVESDTTEDDRKLAEASVVSDNVLSQAIKSEISSGSDNKTFAGDLTAPEIALTSLEYPTMSTQPDIELIETTAKTSSIINGELDDQISDPNIASETVVTSFEKSAMSLSSDTEQSNTTFSYQTGNKQDIKCGQMIEQTRSNRSITSETLTNIPTTTTNLMSGIIPYQSVSTTMAFSVNFDNGTVSKTDVNVKGDGLKISNTDSAMIKTVMEKSTEQSVFVSEFEPTVFSSSRKSITVDTGVQYAFQEQREVIATVETVKSGGKPEETVAVETEEKNAETPSKLDDVVANANPKKPDETDGNVKKAKTDDVDGNAITKMSEPVEEKVESDQELKVDHEKAVTVDVDVSPKQETTVPESVDVQTTELQKQEMPVSEPTTSKEKATTAEEVTPVQEVTPAQDATPVQEVKPVQEESKPVQDQPVQEELKPAQEKVKPVGERPTDVEAVKPEEPTTAVVVQTIEEQAKPIQKQTEQMKTTIESESKAVVAVSEKEESIAYNVMDAQKESKVPIYESKAHESDVADDESSIVETTENGKIATEKVDAEFVKVEKVDAATSGEVKRKEAEVVGFSDGVKDWADQTSETVIEDKTATDDRTGVVDVSEFKEIIDAKKVDATSGEVREEEAEAVQLDKTVQKMQKEENETVDAKGLDISAEETLELVQLSPTERVQDKNDQTSITVIEEKIALDNTASIVEVSSAAKIIDTTQLTKANEMEGVQTESTFEQVQASDEKEMIKDKSSTVKAESIVDDISTIPKVDDSLEIVLSTDTLKQSQLETIVHLQKETTDAYVIEKSTLELEDMTSQKPVKDEQSKASSFDIEEKTLDVYRSVQQSETQRKEHSELTEINNVQQTSDDLESSAAFSTGDAEKEAELLKEKIKYSQETMETIITKDKSLKQDSEKTISIDTLEIKIDSTLDVTGERSPVDTKDSGSSQLASSKRSSESTGMITKESSETVEETRESISEKTSPSSRMQILEVSTVRVTRQEQTGTEVESAHKAHAVHHHNPPELIVPANSERMPVHSDVELLVKVKASKRARATWYHDNRTVQYTEHCELVTEEEPVKK